MNKKLSIFAIVLIIVGLIGSIWSGFFSMPYFINKIQDYNNQVNKSSVIYEKNISINELNIDTKDINVKIVKSDSDKVEVKSIGFYKNVDVNITNNNSVLSIKEIDKEIKTEKIKNIDDFMAKILEENFSNHENIIIVYVPNDINLKVATESGYLIVEDDIFLNEFSFNTSSGNISLPNAIKNLKELNISSQGYVSLQLAEILGIKEVNIYSSNVYISSDKINLDEVEKYIPEKLNIKSNNLEDGNISIESSVPVSENLKIDGYKSRVDLNLPLNNFKFKFDINAYENIYLNKFLDSEVIEKDKTLKKLESTINKNLKNEYEVNIQASNIDFN